MPICDLLQKEIAVISLSQLAKVLGGVVSGRSVLCPGPLHSPKDRSLCVTPADAMPAGFICQNFAGDDWRTCRDHVLARIGHASRERAPPVDRTAAAVKLWNKSQDPGQLVRDYHALRGLKLPDDVAGRVVRFHQRCPWRTGGGLIEHRPAMILAFRNIADDRLTAIHRVALAPDGTKIGRMMLGAVGGAAIKVDGDADIEQGLAVGEGYETALAGRQLGFAPVWALGSAGAIATLPVLSGIDSITILAETDDAGANARAARTCARAWVGAGREALIAIRTLRAISTTW
jgi:putative DNA primase/helicase